MTDKPCRFELDEVCVNAECPMCADFCPVPDTPGVCRYEDRQEEKATAAAPICKYCASYIQDAELCRSPNGCYNPRPEDFCSYYSKTDVLDRYEN